MVKTYKPNDFNRKCQIGVTKTVTTPTGGKVEKIDPATVLNVRFAAKMRSLALQLIWLLNNNISSQACCSSFLGEKISRKVRTIHKIDFYFPCTFY